MKDMLHAFNACVGNWDDLPIRAFKVDQVFNFSGWLGDSLNALTNHSHPHCFKLQKEDGTTRLFTKNLSTDKVTTFMLEKLNKNFLFPNAII